VADTVIQVHSSRIVITGINFMTYANRYCEAASLAKTKSKALKGFDPVPYQLYCQSLELHLKSFIWLQDQQLGRNTIRNRYGHNLKKLWEHSKDKGIKKYIKLTPLREKVIELVSPYYKDRKFCYLDIDMIYDGYTNLKTEPKSLETLHRLSIQLGKSLKRPIYGASQPQ